MVWADRGKERELSYLEERDGVAVNGGRVKEEHVNNETKKEKQKNLECSSNAFKNDEKSKTIIFKWKQFITGREETLTTENKISDL